MLAYYLQWMQRLKALFKSDGVGKNKRWNFANVILRLKSIHKTEHIIKGNLVKTTISEPEEEQKKILDLLGVKFCSQNNESFSKY